MITITALRQRSRGKKKKDYKEQSITPQAVLCETDQFRDWEKEGEGVCAHRQYCIVWTILRSYIYIYICIYVYNHVGEKWKH